MKVMTVLGTRPEIIRLSRVIPLLDELCDHVLVHTGQNWDEKLSDVFFSDLGVRPPDHLLDISRNSLGDALGDVLSKSFAVITEEEPDAFLVLGDTNSALSAVIAKRLHVPVYHMEAGNRSFDENVPEETNRRLVDHIADFNIAYTEHARRNLLAEGLHPRKVAVTGSPMREVLDHYAPRIAESSIVGDLGLQPGAYFMASTHREENVDTVERLAALVACLQGLAEAFAKPVVMSTHPRTRKRLEALGPRPCRRPRPVLGAVRVLRLRRPPAGGSVRDLRQRHDLGGVGDARLPLGHAARLHGAARGPGGRHGPDVGTRRRRAGPQRSRRDQRSEPSGAVGLRRARHGPPHGELHPLDRRSAPRVVRRQAAMIDPPATRRSSPGGHAVSDSLTAAGFVPDPRVALVETARPGRTPHAAVVCQNAWNFLPRSDYANLVTEYAPRRRALYLARRRVAGMNTRRADINVVLSAYMRDLLADHGRRTTLAEVTLPWDLCTADDVTAAGAGAIAVRSWNVASDRTSVRARSRHTHLVQVARLRARPRRPDSCRRPTTAGVRRHR